MRGAKSALASSLLLVSCGKQVPDFNYAILSPKNNIVATISGFQPRGTIEGSLVVSFGENSNAHIITIIYIKNGSIGWLDSGRLFAVGDHIEYQGIDSYYYPDGTVENAVRFVVCSRDEQDCSLFDKAIKNGVPARKFEQFPEK